MGKQIKLINIIKKLIEVNKARNPSADVKIKYIGLQKGEKISEKLYLNKITRSKLNKDILIANEHNYNQEITKNLLKKLSSLLENYNEKKIIKEMKLFLKKEIA